MNPEDQAQYNQDMANNAKIRARTATSQVPNPTAPSSKTPAIAANILTANPTPAVVAPVTPSTGTGALEGFINANITQQKTQKQIDAENAKNQLSSDTNQIASLIQRIGNQSQTQETAYRQQGVDEAQRKADDYTNQIEAEQLASRRAIEQLDKNTGGMFGGAVEQEKNRINRESISKQADLAILQTAATRRYDTARAIADRQVQATLEPLKAALDARKFIYENNKSLFDKADEKALREEERALNKQEKDLQEINDIKITAAKNGADIATITAISNAKTPAEAISKGARYMSDPLDRALKQAQLDKLRGGEDGESLEKIVTINGKSYIQNKDGTFTEPKIAGDADLKVTINRGVDKISKLDNLLSFDEGINASSGLFKRTNLINKAKVNDWRADVKNTLSKLVVDELGRIKTDGVTFGALSDPERLAVGEAATALNAGMIMKDGMPTGRFKLSEEKVRQELETIRKAAELDFERRTGFSYSDYQKYGNNVVSEKTTDDYYQTALSALETNINPYSMYDINTNL